MKRLQTGKPVRAKGRAVVGIDVGKRKHAATALTPNGERIAQLASFLKTRVGIDLLEKEILRKAGGPGKVLVCCAVVTQTTVMIVLVPVGNPDVLNNALWISFS